SNAILEQVCQLVGEFQAIHDIDGVGISSAGVVVCQKGEIVYAGNTIPGYIGTNDTETVK
ncbi:ROK family protein, partial [Enterococcus faecalis]